MKIVGQRVPRSDAADKALGRTRFVADLGLAGMLHAATLRSPHPRAAIKAIDIAAALSLPGVKAVLMARDIPGCNEVPVVRNDMPLLAADRVNYVGEPVALVAAETVEAARSAVAAIVVEYEPLPPLLDPSSSRETNSPRLFEDDNTFATHRLGRGDPIRGRRESAAVVSGVFETPCQEHAYIETQGMIAAPSANGGIEVVGSMQCPFYVQAALSRTLALPLSKIVVRQAATGGAFGGKEDVPSLPACHAALLALNANRPVKLIYRRDEDMICMSKRHPARLRRQIGRSEEGKLTFIEGEVVLDGGAYATLSPVVLWRSVIHAAGAYVCPNVAITGHAVATNHVPAGAFRGFGSPQSLFAVESLVVELAIKTGRDPAAFRALNMLREGGTTSAGQKIDHSCGLPEGLQRTLEASGWQEKKKEFMNDRGPILRGIGLSTIFYGVGLGAGGSHMARTGAYLNIAADGSAQIAVGTTEIGQGMQTVLAQMAAEALGIAFDRVTWIETDTSRVPDSGPTVASRATTMSGNAVLDACAQAKAVLLRTASGLLDVPPERLEINGTAICEKGKNHSGLPVDEVIARCQADRLPMAFQGFARAGETSWDAKAGQGNPYVVYAYAVNVVLARVDRRSGQVTVEKIWAAHDVGRAINPLAVEGQIEGGVLQGMGYALFEDYALQEGRPYTPDLNTYVIPAIADVPAIEPIIVEAPYRDGPFGAKGFGEQPLMGVAPAILNAIRDAVGVRLTRLPATPERLLDALQCREDEAPC